MPYKLIGVSSQARIALLIWLSGAATSVSAAPLEMHERLAEGTWRPIVKIQGSPRPRLTPTGKPVQQQNQQKQRPTNPFGPLTK